MSTYLRDPSVPPARIQPYGRRRANTYVALSLPPDTSGKVRYEDFFTQERAVRLRWTA